MVTEAKAAINAPAAKTSGGCGSGDTSQRDELLAKIATAKQG